MNINDLNATLVSIKEQMEALEQKHESAINENNFDAAAMLSDTFEVLADRERDIENRIKEARLPLVKCARKAALVAANID